MAIDPSILARKISWTEEAGGLLFMGSQRVRHNWVTKPQHLIMVFICNSLMINKVEHLFIVLICHLYIPFSDMSLHVFAICISPSVTCPFMSFACFLVVLSLLRFDRSLDFLETRPWQLPGLQILSSLWSSSVHYLTSFLPEQKFFILMRFSFSIFPFLDDFISIQSLNFFPGLGNPRFSPDFFFKFYNLKKNFINRSVVHLEKIFV